jgi:opacity protein-like surface antigen
MKTKSINKTQKIFLIGLVLIAAFFLFNNHGARAADLLYSNPLLKHAYVTNEGWYIGAKAGANQMDDVTAHTSPTNGATASFDTGYDLSGQVGYQFSSMGFLTPRIEVEAGHLGVNNKVAQAFNAGGATGSPFPVGGSLGANYGFVNALFDINTNMPLTPFFGGGVGYAQVNAVGTVGGFTVLNDSDNAWAYNLTGGVSYAINDRVTLDVAYRYISFQGVNLQGIGSLTVNQDIHDQEITAGVRVKI